MCVVPLAVRGRIRQIGHPAMADERFIVMTVECPRCETKQKVHVAFRAGFGQMGDQTFECLKCDNYFKATVPDKIIGRTYRDLAIFRWELALVVPGIEC